MAKPAVVMVGADKGGVGKTTVAGTVLDYFRAHHVPAGAYDSEAPKGTLKRFHPDVTDIVDVRSVSPDPREQRTAATSVLSERSTRGLDNSRWSRPQQAPSGLMRSRARNSRGN